MKRSNSEILNKVKNLVSEKKGTFTQKVDSSIKKEVGKKNEPNEVKSDIEINSWIEKNAERIAKEIIQKEVKKIFK